MSKISYSEQFSSEISKIFGLLLEELVLESTNFTRTVRFAQISREIGVLFGQAGRDFCILGVNFHICRYFFMRVITMITLVLEAGDNGDNYHRILDLASTPATAPSVMILIALM